MKKKIVTILSLFVMIMAVFLFVGCDKPNNYSDTKTDSNTEDESYAGCGLLTSHAGCVFDPAGYDIDNVTFEVYFGTAFSPASGNPELDLEYTAKRGRGYEYADILFYPLVEVPGGYLAGEERYYIRRIDDYTSWEYWCTSTAGLLLKEDFHHHETVTAPKELFVGDSGKFGFNVLAKRITPDPGAYDPDIAVLGVINAWYTIVDGKVFLTSEQEMRN